MAYPHSRAIGREIPCHRCSVVPAGRQSRGFPRGVDAPDVHRDGGEAGHTEYEHGDECRQRERCLDRRAAGLTA